MFVNFIACFFIKHPMINPLLGRHTRVNRFSRGLIHYGGYFFALCVYSALQHIPVWNWYWLFFQIPIVHLVMRGWNFLTYNLITQEIPFLWMLMTAIFVVGYIGI